MCVCIDVYVYMCVCIHVYVHMCGVCICVYCVFVHTCGVYTCGMCMCVCIYVMCVCVRSRVHLCSYVLLHTCQSHRTMSHTRFSLGDWTQTWRLTAGVFIHRATSPAQGCPIVLNFGTVEYAPQAFFEAESYFVAYADLDLKSFLPQSVLGAWSHHTTTPIFYVYTVDYQEEKPQMPEAHRSTLFLSPWWVHYHGSYSIF